MSKLIAILAVALAFAVAPAGANLDPERALVPAPAVEAPAPEWTGGQCFAVPAECGSGSAADILLLAVDCSTPCSIQLENCEDLCPPGEAGNRCKTACGAQNEECKDVCGDS